MATPAPGWRTSLVAHGFGLRRGNRVPVVVGLIETARGGFELALSSGEDGELVILPDEVGAQLIVHLRTAIEEKLQLSGQRLGGDRR